MEILVEELYEYFYLKFFYCQEWWQNFIKYYGVMNEVFQDIFNFVLFYIIFEFIDWDWFVIEDF